MEFISVELLQTIWFINLGDVVVKAELPSIKKENTMKRYPRLITWCRAFGILSLLAVLAVSVGCTTMQMQATSQQKAMVDTGVTNDWPTYNGSYAGDRFSRLDEVTSQNVSSLRKTCTFDTGEKGAFQNGPIVVNGVIFLTTDVNTYAIDGATCEQKWKHTRDYSVAPETDMSMLSMRRRAALSGTSPSPIPNEARLFRSHP